VLTKVQCGCGCRISNPHFLAKESVDLRTDHSITSAVVCSLLLSFLGMIVNDCMASVLLNNKHPQL